MFGIKKHMRETKRALDAYYKSLLDYNNSLNKYNQKLLNKYNQKLLNKYNQKLMDFSAILAEKARQLENNEKPIEKPIEQPSVVITQALEEFWQKLDTF